jgi:uncharacterized protein (DUF3820 family)
LPALFFWPLHFLSYSLQLLITLLVSWSFLNDFEYQCHKLPRICSVWRNHNLVLSSFMIYHNGCNIWSRNSLPFRITWYHPGYKRSSCWSTYAWRVVFFVDHPLSFYFWPLYCLLLWFTDSDYPYGILAIVLSSLIYGFWLPLWYLGHCIVSFSDLQILITPMVSWPLHCLLWFTDSDYPYGILAIVLSTSLIYGFWLPVWYLETFLM